MLLLDRIRDLLQGKVEPTTMQEDILLVGYQDGLENKSFFQSYLELTAVIDFEDLDCLHSFCIGYGLGEQDRDKLTGETSEETH